MSDIFLTEDVKRLLHNKFVVIIGDSVQRAMYKDLVVLLQKNCYLSNHQLRTKGEQSHAGDKLVEIGEMTNKLTYREVRQYQAEYYMVRFYFTTRCYNDYMETVFCDLKKDPQPDVVIMNSCLWDITRYGPNGVPEYKKNLEKLFTRFKGILPSNCLVIWNATMPVASKIKGGFLIPEVEFMSDTLRLDIMEANFYARQVVVNYDYDVLDLHYYLRRQLHRRAPDGVHWDMTAHRRMTNLILTHIAEAWGVGLPCRMQPYVPGKSTYNHVEDIDDRQPLSPWQQQDIQLEFGRSGNPPEIQRWVPPHNHPRSISHDPSVNYTHHVPDNYNWQEYQGARLTGPVRYGRPVQRYEPHAQIPGPLQNMFGFNPL